jgi:hypothetical protein
MINQDLLIGRVYLGAYPNGTRMFTFPMTRKYSFAQIMITRRFSLLAPSPAARTFKVCGEWMSSPTPTMPAV